MTEEEAVLNELMMAEKDKEMDDSFNTARYTSTIN